VYIGLLVAFNGAFAAGGDLISRRLAVTKAFLVTQALQSVVSCLASARKHHSSGRRTYGAK